MLPPESDFPESFENSILKKFDVDFKTMTLDSDLGKGKIERCPDGEQTITFFDIESHIDDQLVLTKRGAE
jgi:hypothetical protein